MLQKILKNRNLSTILITFFVFGLIYILSNLGLFYSLNKSAQDTYYNLKTLLVGSKVSKDLIIVEIDEKTLSKVGGFPFDRKVYSKLIENLTDANVPVIGFDIIFEDKTNPVSDLHFSRAIKKSQNVIFGLTFTDNEIKQPLKILGDNIIGSGFLRPSVDKKTGVIYSIIPSSSFGGKLAFEHFSIAILKAYYSYIYNKDYISNIYGTRDNFYYITDNIKAPLSRKYGNELLINYVDRNKFKSVSFVDVYDIEKFNELKKEIDFKDKIIIIGTTAKGIKDIFNTPNGIEYGIYVHANMINTILTKSFLIYFDKNLERILVLLLVIVSVYFNFSRSGFVLIVSNLLLISLFWIIFPIYLLTSTNLVINFPVELVFAFIFSLAFSNIVKFVVENKNRLKLNRALSEYVSGNIAEEILSGAGKINLNGENKEIAIFFSDIAGFTSISEKLSPEGLVGFLRQYLTQMSDLVISEKGFVNKYEGDSILALWGVFGKDEKSSYRACLTAIKQQRFLKTINKTRKEKGLYEIKVRMGIHFGNAIIGNIGSPGKKLEFTALGDSVNLASRLEGVNKYYGTNICVSEKIYNDTKEYFEFRYLDTIRVKGKKIGVKIYELFDEKGKTSLKQNDIVKKFENAVLLYNDKKFEAALEIFSSLEKFGDNPSSTYKKRCEMYVKNPPNDNWDGIRTMESK